MMTKNSIVLVIGKVDVVQLPEDMLIEILIYLPVKSLMRFKCVSKYLYSLIKSPTFLTRHVKRDCKKILLVKRYVPPENSDVDDAFKPGGDDILSFHDPDFPEFLVSPSLTVPFFDNVDCRYQIILMGPCIGLVCVMCHQIIVLCNPALREFKLLESSPFDCPDGYRDINYGSGFGFDDNSNSYKIILMWEVFEIDHYSDDEYIRTELYNSSTDSWKIIDVEVPHVCYNPGFDLLFNGVCHWEANEYIEGPPAMGIILSFDLGTKLFHQFEFPNWFDDDKYHGLVALNECLALVRYSRLMEEPYLIDIWMMKEYGNKDSWIKELVIGPYLFASPLLCWSNEWLVVESIDNQLAHCALHANQFKKFQFHGFDGSFRALIYKESIIRLDQAKINFRCRND